MDDKTFAKKWVEKWRKVEYDEDHPDYALLKELIIDIGWLTVEPTKQELENRALLNMVAEQIIEDIKSGKIPKIDLPAMREKNESLSEQVAEHDRLLVENESLSKQVEELESDLKFNRYLVDDYQARITAYSERIAAMGKNDE